MMTPEEAQAREETLVKEAFGNDRWVLWLVHTNGYVAAMFTPTYDEAPFFLRTYAAPFLWGSAGVFQCNSWQPPFPSELEAGRREPSMSRWFRWRDIQRVEIAAETDELRLKLHAVLDHIVAAGPERATL